MFEPYLLRFTFNNCYYEKTGNKAPAKVEDLPFDIPENWTWIRLKHVSFLNGGFAFKSDKFSKEGIRVIRISDFDENGIKSKNIKRYPYEPALEQYEIKCGDILLCMTGGTVGKSTFIHEIDEPSYINQRVALIRINKINTAYFYTVLSSPYLVDVIKSNKTSTNDNISMGLIEDFLIPLPPLIEQQRIVEKINFLEPLIQDYEKYEKQLTELESSFVDKLKKSILQYAIEGKLVKQDQNDEPASVLLERIKAEKEALIKTGKIKRDKNESYIFQGDDKNYYENLPENWCFVPLGSLGTLTRGSGIKRSETVNNGYPCIRYGELYTTYNTSFVHVKSFIPKELYDRSHKIKTNDVVMSLTGENKEDISKGLAYLGLNEIAMGGDMACFSHHKMNPLYLGYVLNSPYGISIKRQLATGDIIVHMSNDRLSSIGIPVPPLNEQERICERIMSICRLID